MEKHYYNAWHSGEGFMIESRSLTYDEALQELEDYAHLEYAYTLEVGLEGCTRFDLQVKKHFGKCFQESEKLTGHEMQLTPGRV